MELRAERRVEDEAVPVRAALLAPVRRQDEDRHRPVLQLVAHLGDRLAVAAATVVHGLACSATSVNKSISVCTSFTQSVKTAS